MTGYEYNGSFGYECLESGRPAIEKIEYECRTHAEDKEDVFEFMWDLVTSDNKLRVELEEWFFQQVAHSLYRSRRSENRQADRSGI